MNSVIHSASADLRVGRFAFSLLESEPERHRKTSKQQTPGKKRPPKRVAKREDRKGAGTDQA